MSYYQHIPYFKSVKHDSDRIQEEFDKLNPDGRYNLNELFPGVTSGKYIKFHAYWISEDDEQTVEISFHKDSGQGTDFQEVLSRQHVIMKMDHNKRQFYIDTSFGVYYLSKGDSEIVQKLKRGK